MSNDMTTEAVRLALTISQLRAETATNNITQASMPNAKAVRLDFSFAKELLIRAGQENENVSLSDAMRQLNNKQNIVSSASTNETIYLDEEVATLSTANVEYSALVESLNKHFGLMRLAITGKGQ